MTAYFASAALAGDGELTVPTNKPVVAGVTVALRGSGGLSSIGQGFISSPLSQTTYAGQSSLEFRVTKYTNSAMTTSFDEVLNGFLHGSYLDEMNGPGTGTVTISTQHPKLLADPTLLSQRNWITVLRNGAIVGRFVLQTKELILANGNASGDMADRLWTVSGEGMRTLLHDAVVYPENGKIDRTTGQTRYFNFGSVNKSKWYVSSQWVTPSVGPKYLAPNSYFLKYPAGYPIANGYWIWASGRNGSNGYAPVGYCYFRGEFTTSAQNQTYSFYAAGDDAMNLFLDGVPIANTAVHQSSFANITAVEGVSLDPGPHVLSAQVYNAQGRAGFIACVRQDANAANGTPLSTLTYTGDSGHWTVCAYPGGEPGWTPGEVMLQLLSEAQSRGVIFPQQLTTTFTANADSAGVPWPSTGSYSFGTNTDYFAVLAALEADGVDAYIDPATLHFNMYNEQGTDYSGAEGQISLNRYANLNPGSMAESLQCFIRVGATGRYFTTQSHRENSGVESTRISRLDRSGTLMEQMILNGAGPGLSIAVQVINGVEWVYVTWSRPTVAASSPDYNIVAFPWPTGVGRGGTRYDRSAVPGLTTILAGGGVNRNVQFDILNGFAVVRTQNNTSDVYTKHTLANFLAGNISSPLNTISLTQSANNGLDGAKSVQGFCTYQGYFFRFTGAASLLQGGDPGLLTQYNWSTSAVVASYDCSHLDPIYEPEGSTLFDVDGSSPTILLGLNTGVPAPHGYHIYALPLNSRVNYANPPTLYLGRDITTSDEVSVAALKNGILAQTADGYMVQVDQASINQYGRVEGGAQTSVTTANAGTILNKTLQLLSTPNVSTTYQIIDSARITPGIDFKLGDWIQAPSMTSPPNSLAFRRVMSITYSTDSQNPNVLYAVELDTIYQDRITNLTQLIQKLSSTDAVTGAATSQAIPSTSAGAPVPSGSPSSSTNVAYPPTSFAVGTITGTYDSNGNPTCALALSWVAPVDEEGNTQNISYYEVYGSTPSNAWALLARIDGTLLTYTLNVAPALVWTLAIRAHPAWNSSAFSDFSSTVVVTSVKPSVALDHPTAPTLTSDLGTVTIHWDGKLTNGTPYTPPVQFKYVSAYMYTNSPSQSDIHQVSGLLTGGGGSLVVTGLTVGTTYYAVLYANDMGGLTSPQSSPASIVCVGVTQANTDAAFQATISSINSAATSAQTTANTALTAANGKNTVHYSTGTPGSTSGTAGDVWFQQDVSGNVTGQFINTGGTTWVTQQLTNTVISTLDAGKITTGTLSSSRIAAGTIVTPQLAIADFTNLFPSPQMTTAQGGSNFPNTGAGPNTAQYPYTVADVPNGNAWVMDDRDNVSTFFFPAKPGDSFYIEYTAKQVKGSSTPLAAALWVQEANGSSGSGETPAWNWYDTLNHILSSGTVAGVTLPNSWVRYYSRVQIPSTWPNVAKAAMYFQIAAQSGGVFTYGWAVSDIIIRRMGTGTLMVDGSITATAIASQTITANNMAAGAITADKLDLGTVAQGSAFNRVPQPLSNQTYWALVIAPGSFSLGGSVGATAGATGISLLPTVSVDAYCFVAIRAPIPQSGTIYVTLASSTNHAYPVVVEYDSGGTPTSHTLVSSTTGVSYSFTATAVTYAVQIFDPHVASPVADNVTFASIFEVIGAAGTGTTAELSPDGLKLYSGQNQNPVLALSASSNDILTMSTVGGDQIASIDTAGNAAFSNVSADVDVDVAGAVLLGPSTNNLANAQGNGVAWPIAAPGDNTGIGLLDIPGRSVAYGATWASINGLTITTQYYAIASGVFTVEDGRVVEISLNNAGIQAYGASNVNVYCELSIALSPMTTAQGAGGSRISRSVIFSGAKGFYIEAPSFFRTSAAAGTIDLSTFTIPANVPIYWQYNTDAGSAPTSFTVAEYGGVRQFIVTDLGSSLQLNNIGFATATDGRTSGSQGGGSGNPTSTTKTFTASWSATYNSSGGNKVTGSGQYDNAHALYQGNGVTPMGAQFGFSASDLANLSGKTVTSASLYIKNVYMAYSGSGVARVSSHSASSATSTIGNAYGANEFNVGWSAGSGKWLTLGSAIRSGLTNGGVKGFQLGIDGSNTDYMYFEGVGYGSHPPQLKVTYY